VTLPIVPSTFLFCPGNRPDRYDKALRSGAPGIIIDLEDAVPEADKASARKDAFDWLAGLGALASKGVLDAVQPDMAARPRVALRIGSPTTPAGLEDLYAFVHAGPLPALHTVVLPKVADATEVLLMASQLLRNAPALRLMPLIETPEGVRSVAAIAQAHPAVSAIGFGAADYCVEAGIAFAWEALLHVRSRMAFDCTGTGVALLDVPYLALSDEAGLREECARVKALGFAGKLAIHPSQVGPILQSFAPSPAEAAWADRVVAGFEAAGRRACRVDGKMVDEPVYLQALRITHRTA
jgi:citrate lyase beta subunit